MVPMVVVVEGPRTVLFALAVEVKDHPLLTTTSLPVEDEFASRDE
jgi:hypothetical protein